jgi:hypothetical protein
VAGPAALVVAKVYKLRNRLAEGEGDRIADKDAADVYRLMLAVPVRSLSADCARFLDDERAGPVCRHAVTLIVQLFGARRATAVGMATEALRVAAPPERIADVCTGFIRELRQELESA